jgi:hypothetical protein
MSIARKRKRNRESKREGIEKRKRKRNRESKREGIEKEKEKGRKRSLYIYEGLFTVRTDIVTVRLT